MDHSSPPSSTKSNSSPKVWCQNCTEPVCPLGLWKWLKFQILAIERIRAKQEHEAGSPGPHQYVRWRADSGPQTTKEFHNVGVWNLRQSCHGQETCEHHLKMRRTLLHNMFFISLATLHLLEMEEKAVSFAWPCFSRFMGQPGLPLEICYLPNPECFKHTLHKCSHWLTTTLSRNTLAWEAQRREAISSGNSFIHWDRWLLRYWFQCSYHKKLRKKCGDTFPSAVLPALGVGELVTVTSFFRLWLLLGKILRSKLSKGSSCCLLSFADRESWSH